MIYVDFTTYKCARCLWRPSEGLTNEEAYDKVIDHIYMDHGGLALGGPIIYDSEQFVLTREKAKALKDFLYANGYISHEFHPLVYDILRDLDRFIGE